MGMKFVPVDAYHMPELPAALKVDPVLTSLLHMACFMELSGDEAVDADEPVTAMEAMGYYLQRLTPQQISQINAQLKRVAAYGRKQKWKKDALACVSKLLENSGIEA
jgi:hypothetical protein